MRDLAARLRSIVRQDPPAPRRELTYVPDAGDLAQDATDVAGRLEGTPLEDDPGCLVIDRVWASHESHGRRPVSAYVPRVDAPIALFDPRVSGP
jgi:hypothetical protein